MPNPVEIWKAEKHGLDVWPDVLRYASAQTPMQEIEPPDLERMKWYGAFYRKRDGAGTYMLRIRLTGCEFTADQARAMAFVAYEFGYGIVDVTTRANIQIQGLAIDHVPTALERLEAAGLSARQTGHDNIRNVFCHPFSGVDLDELYDVRQLCHDITAIFVGSRIYSDLPRKFNIAVSGAAHHASHFWSQDISYLACRTPEGDVQFQVLLGGTQGQNPHLPWHLPVLVQPGQVVDVTRCLLDLFREQGSREKRDAARLRYLIERIGISGVLDWLEAKLPFPLRPFVSEPPPPPGYEDQVGWFRQRQPGLWTMGLCVPLGRLSWQQLEGLGLAAKRWGDGALRATPEQGLAILNIPTGFKDAAATAVAAHGVSPYADTLARNTVACTGKQFCNIAVTETKGHMLQLIESLRARALTLHGIRIHMSGCPSSCAQHFTADIGLKGVRVRRLLGTREGFDVYLGGGIAGQVHLGLLYKLGVDVDQLPQLIEEVVREYYLHHKPGLTFSAFWREKLREPGVARVGDGEYSPPIWLCDVCQHEHKGEDPPVFCPKCAGLRRNFARLEACAEPGGAADATERAAPRADGFLYVAEESRLVEGAGLQVELAGKEYALFRTNDGVCAIDNACPHEGAPLAQGEMANGIVTCPWHGWTFKACNGCSIDPAGHDVKSYAVKLEGGRIFLNTGAPPAATPPAKMLGAARAVVPQQARLKVFTIIQETPDVKTFRLDNSAGQIPTHRAGQFVKVCATIDGRDVWRSFTISSPPDVPSHIDLTIKRNPGGEFSNFLHDAVELGGELVVKGPQGKFYFDPAAHPEPLVLISAGSGVTPMMSILRHMVAIADRRPCVFVQGARTEADIIFHAECQQIAVNSPHLNYQVTLSQPSAAWPGLTGRLTFETICGLVPQLQAARFFLCGPGSFMDTLCESLMAAGIAPERIHTEEFQTSSVRPAMTAK